MEQASDLTIAKDDRVRLSLLASLRARGSASFDHMVATQSDWVPSFHAISCVQGANILRAFAGVAVGQGWGQEFEVINIRRLSFTRHSAIDPPDAESVGRVIVLEVQYSGPHGGKPQSCGHMCSNGRGPYKTLTMEAGHSVLAIEMFSFPAVVPSLSPTWSDARPLPASVPCCLSRTPPIRFQMRLGGTFRVVEVANRQGTIRTQIPNVDWCSVSPKRP